MLLLSVCRNQEMDSDLLSVWGDLMIRFPGSSDGKESTCNAGDLGSIPG